MALKSVSRTLGVLVVVGTQTARAQDTTRADSTRDTTRAYSLAPVVVTASRVALSSRDVGFGLSVLGRTSLTAEPASYAARLLTRLPGIAIEEGAGPGGPTVLHLRGGDEPFTQLLIDGVAINLNGGYLDLEGLTLANVDRIEVARGPQSALYGSSAMAGVVQLLSRRGQVGPPRFELLAEGGRATKRGEQARSEISGGGGTEQLRYSAGGGATYNRGKYGIANNQWSRDGSLRLDAAPDARWTLAGTLRYMNIDSHLPVRDPGATRVPLDPNQRDGRDRVLGSLEAGFDATPSWHHRLLASSFREVFFYQDEKDGITDTTSYPFFVFDANFILKMRLRRNALEYVGTNEIPLGAVGARAAASYGARWEREDETDDQGGDFGASHGTFHRTSRAAFAEIHGRLHSGVSLLAGARIEKLTGLPAEFLPRASIVIPVVGERLAVRAATGRGFKGPNFAQQFLDNPFIVSNPQLRPETSASWEGGASFSAPQRAFTLGVGYFSQHYHNLIRTVAADTGTKQTNKNLGRTRAQGIEVELERRWSDRWLTGLNATWVRTKIVDNRGLSSSDYPEGAELPAVPRVTGNAYVEATLPHGIGAVLRGRLVGAQTVFTERFSGQRVKLDPYTLLDLSVRWQATRSLGLNVRVENLLDTDYAVAYDKPGVPLTAVVGVRVNN